MLILVTLREYTCDKTVQIAGCRGLLVANDAADAGDGPYTIDFAWVSILPAFRSRPDSISPGACGKIPFPHHFHRPKPGKGAVFQGAGRSKCPKDSAFPTTSGASVIRATQSFEPTAAEQA